MENYLSDSAHEVRWAEYRRLYTVVPQLSKKTSSKICSRQDHLDWEAVYTEVNFGGEDLLIARRNSTGRPDSLQVQCKLCKEIFARSDFTQHFDRSHGKTKAKYQVLPGYTEQKQDGTQVKVYYCSVCPTPRRMN